MLESLRDLPIVGDVRGAGYFHAIELVKDKETKETFDDDEAETLLRGFLSGELYRRGLICRADDRGDPVIQLSPPLIAGPEQFQEIEGILRGRPHRGQRADARSHPGSSPPASGASSLSQVAPFASTTTFERPPADVWRRPRTSMCHRHTFGPASLPAAAGDHSRCRRTHESDH